MGSSDRNFWLLIIAIIFMACAIYESKDSLSDLKKTEESIKKDFFRINGEQTFSKLNEKMSSFAEDGEGKAYNVGFIGEFTVQRRFDKIFYFVKSENYKDSLTESEIENLSTYMIDFQLQENRISYSSIQNNNSRFRGGELGTNGIYIIPKSKSKKFDDTFSQFLQNSTPKT